VMVMAQHNVIVASEHLFARKGEAAPAGRPASALRNGCVSHFPQNSSKQQKAKKGKSKKGDLSPLSGLIQRQVHLPENPGGTDKTIVSEHEVYANWRKLKSRLEAPDQPEQKEQWKKLTFRIRHDQYVRLKNLSGLWSTTYQSILEKAVTYYIDEATTSEGSE